MSYNKRTWATGNVVGAVDLNRIENGIADIDVDEIRGWGVETTTSQLLSETVTTTDQDGLIYGKLVYATQITADSIVVTFNGTDYTVAKQEPFEGATGYGTFSEQGPLFTTYPFFIMSFDDGLNQLYTETAGSYAVAVGTPSTIVEVSDTFKTAVNNAAPLPMLCVSGVTTYDEMIAAKNAKRLLYFWTETEGYGCYIIRTVDFPCVIYPPTASVVANFDNNNVLVIMEQ